MPTGQDIVNSALTALGVLEQGGTPSNSDSVDALQELNDQWESWGIDEGMIYAVIAGRYALAADVGVYTIGLAVAGDPQPNFRAKRPAKIYRASISQATGNAINANSLYSGGLDYVVSDTGIVNGSNGAPATYTVNTVDANGAVLTYTVSSAGTGYTPRLGATTTIGGAQPGIGAGFRLTITSVTAGGSNRNPIRIIESAEYYAHNDLSASGTVSDELYPEYNVNVDGFATLYLYPVPKVLAASVLELETGVNFEEWTLVDNYQIPQGFRDDIKYALAYRLMSSYGALVQADVAANITQKAQKAEARVREMNAYNRKLAPEAVGLAAPAEKGA